MVTVELLKQRTEAYVSGNISLGKFEEWLRDESIEPFVDSQIEDLVFDIESALSELHTGGIGQSLLRDKLSLLVKNILPRSSGDKGSFRKIYVVPQTARVPLNSEEIHLRDADSFSSSERKLPAKSIPGLAVRDCVAR